MKSLVARLCVLALLVTTTTAVGSTLSAPITAQAALPPAPATAGTMTTTGAMPASFVASGVDIWSGVPNSAVSWNVASASWNTGSQSKTEITSFPGGVNFRFDSSGCGSNLLNCFHNPGGYVGFDTVTKTVGFAASAHTNGSVALSGRASGLRTSAATGVSYPGSASFTYPSARSFTAGSTVSVGGSWTLAPGATINASTTSGAFDFNGSFGLGGGASATAYLAYASPGGAIIPDFNWSSGDQTIFSLSPFDGTPRCCPLTPISGQLSSLSVDPTAVTVNGDGSITATGTNKFSDVVFDIDGIVTKLSSGLAPAVSRNVDMSAIGVPIQVGYNIFDAKAPIQLYADQTLTFRQDGARIRLALSAPVAGFTGAYLAADPGNTWVEFRPGANVGIQTLAGRFDPITVTPSVTLDNPRLANATQMRTTGRVDLSSGGFDLSLPGFEVFPAIGGFDTGLAYPESLEAGFECDLTVAGHCVFGHPTFSITWHEIYVPSFGPWRFGGVSTHWGPLWAQTYGASQTPNTLADATQPVDTGRVTLASFQLQPNRPPVAAIAPMTPVTEGAVASFSGAGSSDPDNDPLTYAWTFGDGLTGTGVAPTHVYADNGNYPVSLTVTDSFGQSNTARSAIAVSNVPPTVTAPAALTADEGSTVAPAAATFNDKGTLDTHTAIVNWGDGSAVAAGAVTENPFGPPGSTAGANGSVALGSHVYADNGTYTVTVAVTDKDGASTASSFAVIVRNVAPTVVAAPAQTVNEGSTLALATAAFNDKGTLDTHTATIDWGDATAIDTGAVGEHPFGPPGSTAGANGSVAGSHVYADNGSYTVRTCVTDDDGATTCASFVTTVLNVPPTAILRGGPVTQHWGVPITLTADITDPSPVDTAAGFTNHWVWGDGTPDTTDHSLTPAQATHTYDQAGPYTARFDATDKDGGNDARSRDAKAMTIVRRPTTLSCTAANATFGYTSPASATVVDPIDPTNARLLGRTVTFNTGAYTWTTTTNGGGLGTTQTPTQPADGSIPPLLPGLHTVTVGFAGDVNYEPSTATCDYTVSSSNGNVQAETRQGPGGSFGQIHIQASGSGGILSGEVTYKIAHPWVLRSRTVTGIGIRADGRTAWLSGIGDAGQLYVLYTEDNGPRTASIARLWIDGILQDGDGLATNGQVHITLR